MILGQAIKHIQNSLEINKVAMMKIGMFVVRFVNMQGATSIILQGVCYFNNKPFILNAWNPEVSINTTQIAPLHIRVQFPSFYIKYQNMESLGKLGSISGIPIKTDKHTNCCTPKKSACYNMIDCSQRYVLMALSHNMWSL